IALFAGSLITACVACSLALRRLSAYACSFGSVTSTQQALRCALLPATGSSGGIVRQILRAKAQRGINGQPGGGFSKSGGAPSMVLNVACLASSRRGTEASRPNVYGWRGLANNSSVGASSTTLPAYITTTRSVI